MILHHWMYYWIWRWLLLFDGQFAIDLLVLLQFILNYWDIDQLWNHCRKGTGLVVKIKWTVKVIFWQPALCTMICLNVIFWQPDFCTMICLNVIFWQPALCTMICLNVVFWQPPSVLWYASMLVPPCNNVTQFDEMSDIKKYVLSWIILSSSGLVSKAVTIF